MRHITIVTPTYFPIRGGTEQVIFEWVSRLNKKYTISIITPRIQNTSYEEKQFDNVTIYRFKYFNIPIINHLSRCVKICWFLKKINKMKSIDIIHLCHVLETGLGVLLYTFFKKNVLFVGIFKILYILNA